MERIASYIVYHIVYNRPILICLSLSLFVTSIIISMYEKNTSGINNNTNVYIFFIGFLLSFVLIFCLILTENVVIQNNIQNNMNNDEIITMNMNDLETPESQIFILTMISHQDNNKYNCPICLDNGFENDLYKCICENVYHKSCISKWINITLIPTCPVCRRLISI